MPLEEGDRTFTVEEIRKSGQQNKSGTHKKTKGSGGRFVVKAKTNQTIMSKAKIAFNAACNKKEIYGQCTLDVFMRETTAGSDKGLYGYKCKRTLKSEPVVIKLKDGTTYTSKYDTTATPIKI